MCEHVDMTRPVSTCGLTCPKLVGSSQVVGHSGPRPWWPRARVQLCWQGFVPHVCVHMRERVRARLSTLLGPVSRRW